MKVIWNFILVCQRWESLSKMMWSSVKKLDFTVGPLANFRLTGLKLKQFLSLCPNLTSINIATEYHMHSSNAIITIGKYFYFVIYLMVGPCIVFK